LAAWFWSKQMVASYQASGSRLSGLPEAIVATASAIKGLSPHLNLTTMVFGSEYPKSDIRSQKSSR
jgi:hypothetical protein